ncbi:MAG: aminotransferase class V-fold PLP-dependent enzyme [Oscillospiraceae bacterium]|nr:aminotransferase class V-fold PLP-dependent enzyme [Oscillospiraceae bacterium]
MIYLDSAATTLKKPPEVINAAASAIFKLGSPGRGGHEYAMRAAECAYTCRERAARLFNVENPENVVFTMNATHALNIAISSLVERGDRVLISSWEHNAVLRPLIGKSAELLIAETAPFEGENCLNEYERLLKTHPKCAVLNHASNVTGSILPIYEIAELCSRYGVPLIVDASQSAGAMRVDMAALGAAFIAMPGHKGLYGPQGTGLLLCGVMPKPFLLGGSGSDSASGTMPAYLPDLAEAGTHNMPGIAGLSEGLDFVLRRGIEKIHTHESSLIRRAAEGLRGKGAKVWLSEAPERQTGVLSFVFDDEDPESTASRYNDSGFALRAGLHCAPLAHKSLGTFPRGTVRLSVSAFTTMREVEAFLKV